MDLLAEIDALTEEAAVMEGTYPHSIGLRLDALSTERDSLRAEVARLTAEREAGLAAMTHERDEWRETARRLGGGR